MSANGRQGEKRLDLATRLALRPAEAAQALGIGERTLRQILPELPHVRFGGVVLLPVERLLRGRLEERAKTEHGHTKECANAQVAGGRLRPTPRLFIRRNHAGLAS